MADDRYSRLLAAITARRELAEAATVGPWATRVFGAGIRSATPYAWVVRPDGGAVFERHNYGTLADVDYVAANDPAQVLRDTAAHLRIVERHKPALPYTDPLRGEVDPFDPRRVCVRCAEEDWPCPDWLDVASSYPESEV